jgi:localization factor PodJL
MTQQLSQLADLNAAQAQASRDPREEETARQLAAAISQLDRRLDQVIAEGRSAKSEIEQRVSAVDRAVADLNRDRPRMVATADPPTPLDQALLEIADRQRALDGYSPLPAEGSYRAPLSAEALPRPRTQELSGLEQQLRQINSRIETLAQPCGLDKAVETLRDDLAEIGVMLQDAMPRKAIEALEGEVRKLAERVDHSRHAGADGPALTGVEHGLAEVRDALHGLTPAENLVGIDRTVQELSQKVDLIAHSAQDPAALRQLESSIVAMRGLVSHVASNDALAKLSDEVRALSDKVDQVAGSGGSNIVSALEERITMLADALEARNQRGQVVPHELEAVVRGLTEKIELIQLTHGDQVALGHLEDRIAKLVEKLDASDARLNHLEAIERGLAELLIHLEHQRMPNLARAGNSAPPPEMDVLSRDVDGLREADKRTQDTLEAVHGTLGHVVDRLAMIENDLHSRHVPISAPQPVAIPEVPAVAARNEPTEPIESTGPAAPAAAPVSAYMPIEEIAPEPPAPSAPEPQAAPIAPPEPVELMAPSPIEPPAPIGVAPELPPRPVAPTAPVSPAAIERRPIDPSLPPDHPLEPGLARSRYPGSPADRIAASEAALAGAKPPVIPDPGGKSNFIAAARRAAQAAGRDAPAKNPPTTSSSDIVSAAGKLASRVGKLRMLIGGGAAVLLVLGSAQIARNLLGPSEEAVATLSSPSSQVAISDTANLPTATIPASIPASEPVSVTPSVAPSPSAPSIGRQSTLSPALDALTMAIPKSGNVAPKPAGATPVAEREITASVPPAASAAPAQPPVAPAPVTAPAVTAPAPVASVPPAPAQVPPSPSSPADRLPAAFGHSLRAAAAKGDPAAQYEVAIRYAEGRGVPQNLTDAAEWFDRAAKQGLAPAQFRLGGLYEKGLGVKKNLDIARRFYLTAGEAGHPKALHNLAVLYAEGIDGKPDYQTAARWFRKAADYGVTDSQFNLAVLYTRGIGVDQNLADAYKWFALAAREGDAEAARKRDEVGAKLDQTALQAAARAAQTWTPEPPIEAAIQVKTPPGGWGEAAAAAAPPPPAKRKPPAAPALKLDLATPR